MAKKGMLKDDGELRSRKASAWNIDGELGVKWSME